ncbi:hypothetical protein UFOVP251_44 [uncultured Caudovirales phage]|uniref:Uncharacterized protein n=1 Tax=uncultured Caudovirales phage TaxID=2100421 RepID=A0A6J5LIM8_9CAUD|nr:hypothetical protein UFOVP251_44 [uncultured Caudovirales phage]
MPRALNEFEKRDRVMQKFEERKAAENAPAPAVDGTTRKRRNVFNGTEVKLSVRQEIPGYHLHIFTDTGSRIQEASDSGYEFVTPTEVGGVSENVVSRNGDLGGERIRYLVNPRAEGTEQYGYLMKIRQEWYEEDQAELQAKNNRIDAAIRKGKVTGENTGFYVPQGGIKLT